METNILIVDDEAAIADLVEVYLKNEGYTVHKFGRAGDALACVASTPLDLAILDVMLPDMDGFTLCQKIREAHLFPILMLTARVEDMDKIMGLTLGADDYLTKPFSVDELLARVRANLRRSSMASNESTEASTFDNGPLHIDYAAGYATKDGRELSLTPTEYKLLVLLAKNVDKVLTHTFITREIWGTSWDSDLASLRVFMRTLRKKIEADPSHPKMIQTHMGVGYRMQRL